MLVADGRIVADGTHPELLATSETYREVLAAAAADEEQARHALLEADQVPAGPSEASP